MYNHTCIYLARDYIECFVLIIFATPHEISSNHSPSPSDVLVWTNAHIQEWVCQIGLADHAHCLNESGVHGGVVALDNDLDHEKLSLALQIPLSSFEVQFNMEYASRCLCMCVCMCTSIISGQATTC